jgi:hypothetical protein
MVPGGVRVAGGQLHDTGPVDRQADPVVGDRHGRPPPVLARQAEEKVVGSGDGGLEGVSGGHDELVQPDLRARGEEAAARLEVLPAVVPEQDPAEAERLARCEDDRPGAGQVVVLLGVEQREAEVPADGRPGELARAVEHVAGEAAACHRQPAVGPRPDMRMPQIQLACPAAWTCA